MLQQLMILNPGGSPYPRDVRTPAGRQGFMAALQGYPARPADPYAAPVRRQREQEEYAAGYRLGLAAARDQAARVRELERRGNPAHEYRGMKLEPYLTRRKLSAWRVVDPEGYARIFDTLERAKAWIDGSGWAQSPGPYSENRTLYVTRERGTWQVQFWDRDEYRPRWFGPFGSREEAEREAHRLSEGGRIKVVIVRENPGPAGRRGNPGPVEPGSEEAIRWLMRQELPALRRRQELVAQQLGTAFRTGNTRALERLQQMEADLAGAIYRKTERRGNPEQPWRQQGKVSIYEIQPEDIPTVIMQLRRGGRFHDNWRAGDPFIWTPERALLYFLDMDAEGSGYTVRGVDYRGKYQPHSIYMGIPLSEIERLPRGATPPWRTLPNPCGGPAMSNPGSERFARQYEQLYNRTRRAMGGVFDWPTLKASIPGRAEELRRLWNLAYGEGHAGFPAERTGNPGPAGRRGNPADNTLRGQLARLRAMLPEAERSARGAMSNSPAVVFLHQLRAEIRSLEREAPRYGNPYEARGYKYPTARPETRYFKREASADRYSRFQRLAGYPAAAVYRISEAAYRRAKVRRNPAGRGAAAGFRMFHDADPDKAFKVSVPDGFPRKLYMIGRLAKLVTDRGTVSGGVLAAGGGDRMYVLGASKNLAGSARARQVEYIPPKNSRKAGALYFHKFTHAPLVTRHGSGGNYTIAGQGVKLTPRGIVG